MLLFILASIEKKSFCCVGFILVNVLISVMRTHLLPTFRPVQPVVATGLLRCGPVKPRILTTDAQTIGSLVRKQHVYINKDIKILLNRKKKVVFMSGDKKDMRVVQMELTRELKIAKNKPTAKGNPTNYLQHGNAKEMWSR